MRYKEYTRTHNSEDYTRVTRERRKERGDGDQTIIANLSIILYVSITHFLCYRYCFPVSRQPLY